MLNHFLFAVIAALALALPVRAADAVPIIDFGARAHGGVDGGGMVAVRNAIASEVGAAVLAEGGNAVDAAVAIGMTLAVTLPQAGNIGGGGFMLVYLAEEERTVAIDYREAAPMGAFRDVFLDEEGDVDDLAARFSHRAAGVPGTVAGMHHALTRYGTMSWRDALAPAIDVAERGMRVSPALASVLASRRGWLGRDAATRAIFYKADGSPYVAGEVLRQPDLAKTLRLIARHGPDAFYRGEIADRIVASMEANDGLITHEDLANYRAIEREPVVGTYRGFEVVSMPPPSSGGVLLVQMLNVLERYDLAESGFGSARTIHLMTEAMRSAYADRSQHLGDPDYWQAPYEWLMDKRYAARIAAVIEPDRARRSADVAPGVDPGYESPETTHYSVIDRDGNAVVNTYTLNFGFGNGITVPGAGFLLNNEMDDFSAKPGSPNGYGLIGGEANAIQPGKRPLSSMTPTIVFRDGRPWIATGGRGGSRIITAVLQVIVNVVDHGMAPADAAGAPRFHHQWLPDRLYLEAGFSPDTAALLRQIGHDVQELRPTAASVETVVWDGQWFRGAVDPREPDAAAIGPSMLACRTSQTACAR